MVELFVRVWFLCALAFLAGSAVTWLLFVRAPRRRPLAPPSAPSAPRTANRTASTPRSTRAAPPEPPPPPVEPALANLDSRGREHTARRPGSSAAGALDRLGVAGGPRPPGEGPDAPLPTPEIPAQAGPVDEPRGGEGR
jgi:hypothetical protein